MTPLSSLSATPRTFPIRRLPAPRSPARLDGKARKIKPHDLARKSILYVRQSSTHQMLHSRERQALQYAMRDRLVAPGWSEVDTVDDNLGQSAAVA